MGEPTPNFTVSKLLYWLFNDDFAGATFSGGTENGLSGAGSLGALVWAALGEAD